MTDEQMQNELTFKRKVLQDAAAMFDENYTYISPRGAYVLGALFCRDEILIENELMKRQLESSRKTMRELKNINLQLKLLAAVILMLAILYFA